MFTGLVSDVGEVLQAEEHGHLRRLRIGCGYDPATIEIGASVAHAGVCLTVVDVARAGNRTALSVDVGAETLALTTAGDWQAGTRLNLERSLRLGDELGGHLVSGHVDGLAIVVSATPENGSTRWVFSLPAALAPFVAPKGSIAINGISLTVNEVENTNFGANFGVNIIPHTTIHTNFSVLAVGDAVNIEIDMLARYVARQLAFKNG